MTNKNYILAVAIIILAALVAGFFVGSTPNVNKEDLVSISERWN